jgi:hypothetical protein
MVSTLGWCRWFPNAHAINGVVGFQIEFKVYVPRFYSDLIPPLHRIQTGGVGWCGQADERGAWHGRAWGCSGVVHSSVTIRRGSQFGENGRDKGSGPLGQSGLAGWAMWKIK